MKAAATKSRKSERLHVLVDAKFKRFLQAEAKRAELSVAQLVRRRFEHEPAACTAQRGLSRNPAQTPKTPPPASDG